MVNLIIIIWKLSHQLLAVPTTASSNMHEKDKYIRLHQFRLNVHQHMLFTSCIIVVQQSKQGRVYDGAEGALHPPQHVSFKLFIALKYTVAINLS